MVAKEKKYHCLPTSENTFHFFGFQTLTLAMLLTSASWGFSSSKCAQLIITRVGNSNIHFVVPVRPQVPQPPVSTSIVAWHYVYDTRQIVARDLCY